MVIPLLSPRFVDQLRWAVVAVLAMCLSYYAAVSIHWPILRDTSVMHYVIYLMDHGLKPYQQITDNNMPGAYLTERWLMEIFGRGDLAWRMADFFLLGVITVSMAVIARPCDWVAGLFGGAMFALLHGSEGPDFPVEREEVLTALLFAGYAFFFTSLRRRVPLLMLPFGCAIGVAVCIKPTVAPFALLLLLAAAYILRKQRLSVAPYLLWGVTGLAVAGFAVLHFLLHYDAVKPFLFIVRKITPLYVSMNHLSFFDLLRSMMPRNLLPALAIAIVLALTTRDWTWERWLVFLGTVFAAISFLAQQKGSIYQRYPFVAFVLLILGLEFFGALRRTGWRQIAAALGIAVTLVLSVPHYLTTLRTSPERSTLSIASALTGDLQEIGAPELQHSVQCFDLTFGCFSALYHLDVMQNTGFTGDLLFFSPYPSAAADYYRDSFWRSVAKDPPSVMVITNEWFQANGGFDKIETWPEFSQYLRANYTLVVARSFPIPGIRYAHGVVDPPSYRIYIRNGTPLLAKAEAYFQGAPQL